jgi:hypothetical protein
MKGFWKSKSDRGGERLALAEHNAARGRELSVRQNTLVIKLELEGNPVLDRTGPLARRAGW